MQSIRIRSASSAALRKISGGACALVSRAMWTRPFSSAIVSNRNCGCASGSPPVKVTPPSFILNMRSLRSSLPASSRGDTLSPQISSAPFFFLSIWGANAMPSGLWHHRQRRGQPFRKTVVLIPGPSFTANSSMLNMVPSIAHFAEKLYEQTWQYFSPARRSVDGKFGRLGLSGKCCVSRANAPLKEYGLPLLPISPLRKFPP